MTRGRKWAVVPGLIAIAAVATALSAYRGAQTAAASAPPQSTTAPATTSPATSAQSTTAATATAPQAPAPAARRNVPVMGSTHIDSNPPSGTWGYHGASSYQGSSPEQPVHFPHPKHVQMLGMNCVYCHFAANKSPDPGMPAVGTCMGCHLIIGPDRPAMNGQPKRRSAEIAKVQDYWNKKRPIPWVRIHKVPEYVHFPHMRHVNAGVTCQTCHGQVQKMNQVFQYSSLNMGWCINCHLNGYSPADGARAAGLQPTPEQLKAPPKRARYDCSSCHY
jgi:hypothetical protein